MSILIWKLILQSLAKFLTMGNQQFIFQGNLTRKLPWESVIFLGFKIDKFLFTYLGILVTPTKLRVSHFQHMISRIANCTTIWNHKLLSRAGRIILIHNVLMPNLVYYLSVYPILDTVLDSIFKLVGNFFGLKMAIIMPFNWLVWVSAILNKS